MEPTHGRFDVEKFDGKGDFGLWKHKMLCQLEILGLESTLVEDATTSESGKQEEGGKPKVDPKKADKDKRAKNLISMSLSDLILRKVMKETTALGIWKALERDYQTKTLPNRIYLKHRFTTFKMVEHKSIEENLDVFLKLVADLASIDINISDEDQALQVMAGLPPQYDSLVDTLKYGSGKDTLTLNAVTSSAYSKEIELKEKGLLNVSRPNSEGLLVESRGRKPWKENNRGRSKSRPKYNSGCYICGEEGHLKHECPEKNTGCFICGKKDHWKRDCPERKTRKPTESANVAMEAREPLVLTVSTQNSGKEWVMDSGCTFHSTADKEVLFDFKEFNGGRVLMANNTYGEIKGAGKIRIKNQDGSLVILKDVKYMPKVRRNLISYGMLEKSGCKYEGSNFMVQFYKDNKKVIAGKYHEGLYYLQGTVAKAEEKVSVAETCEQNISKAREEVRKKKSKKVTFRENLIQGPTPYGFKTKDSSVAGGDSSETEISEELKSENSGFVTCVVAATKIDKEEPKTYEEGIKSEEGKHWKIAEEEDMDSQLRRKKLVAKKWYFKSKPGLLEAVEKQKFNARVVTKGCSQKVMTLPKIHTIKIPTVVQREVIPGMKFQRGCELLNVL